MTKADSAGEAVKYSEVLSPLLILQALRLLYEFKPDKILSINSKSFIQYAG